MKDLHVAAIIFEQMFVNPVNAGRKPGLQQRMRPVSEQIVILEL